MITLKINNRRSIILLFLNCDVGRKNEHEEEGKNLFIESRREATYKALAQTGKLSPVPTYGVRCPKDGDIPRRLPH